MKRRYNDDVLQCREKDSSSDEQMRVVNGIWVVMTLVAAHHVLAQTAHIYCRPEMILGELISTTIRDTPVFLDSA